MSTSREYPNRPIIGVGILIQNASKYLLIKRAAEPDKGLWSIPGGLVQVGETLKQAAIREAKEETGLNVKIIKELGYIDKIQHDEKGKVKYHFVIIDFLAEVISGIMVADDDALEALWVEPKDFKSYNLTVSLIQLFKIINLNN
ncbi:NUDIX domain-containing protein [Candidatus Bathyarchaeota archaeon]|nr:NUDIX domain-containing protein [Candidatus Bathyarchaeota archaeon]